MPIQKIRRGGVGRNPRPMKQELMNLVGENQLLELNALLPQSFNQIHHLRKGHVTVVVALNQQHRRVPSLN